jgi:hypothetical protein
VFTPFRVFCAPWAGSDRRWLLYFLREFYVNFHVIFTCFVLCLAGSDRAGAGAGSEGAGDRHDGEATIGRFGGLCVEAETLLTDPR